MKVVAFLQNQWFHDPERMKIILKDRFLGDREKFIRFYLFYGCLTGMRLKKALEEWCDKIVWEEVSREMADKSYGSFDPDVEHIREVLRRHKPTHVIAFGRIAAEGMRLTEGRIITRLKKPSLRRYQPPRKRDNFELYEAPHPASRYPDVESRLIQVRFYLEQEKRYERSNRIV